MVHEFTTNNWFELEHKFHKQFYRAEPEVTVADLARLTQLQGESVDKYIARFRKLQKKEMSNQSNLTERECVRISLVLFFLAVCYFVCLYFGYMDLFFQC